MSELDGSAETVAGSLRNVRDGIKPGQIVFDLRFAYVLKIEDRAQVCTSDHLSGERRQEGYSRQWILGRPLWYSTAKVSRNIPFILFSFTSSSQ